MNAYTKELARIFNAPAPKASHMSSAELERAIDDISDLLRGPMSNADRLALVENRRTLRKQLELACE